MPRPLPNDLGGRAFSVAEARLAGVSEKRLRSLSLSTPFWGVRDSAAHQQTLATLVAARATRMHALWFYSHRTAAQLWGIPLPTRMDSPLPLHISSDADHRGPTGRGTVGHHVQIDARDIRTRHGLQVTSLERTVLDLAGVLFEEEVLSALDNILWRRRPTHEQATPRTIADAFTRYRGRRGRGRLLELIPLASGNSDSPPETAFRYRFHCAGFPPALANVPIVDAQRRFVALPDLQFEGFQMCFDYEGDYHRTDRLQWQKDIARVPRLQDLGWHHTRLSASDLARPEEALRRIERLLVERGWSRT